MVKLVLREGESIMYSASEQQLMAVAQSCRHFDSEGIVNSMTSTTAENVSCHMCKNWDGRKCVIAVFDTVLTSLDQT